MSQEYFSQNRYLVRRKIFKLLGGAYHVYDEAGKVVAYADQKAFKLKEDIRVYTGEDKQALLFTIKARQIVDFSAAYDIHDASGHKVGALKRKGWKSILKDEWIVMDENDKDVALIKEDSALLATIRRFATNLIPQNYGVFVGETEVINLQQNFNPFVYKLLVDFTNDTEKKFNRTHIMAAGILLAAIEGKQN